MPNTKIGLPDLTYSKMQKKLISNRNTIINEISQPRNIIRRKQIAKNFQVFFPGNSIALISLFTPNIDNYALESLVNLFTYCRKHTYTLYWYHQSLDPDYSPAYSKSRAILNHLKNHKYVIWIDADALIVNQEMRWEQIINININKSLFACQDIGAWFLNSGVLIWKNTEWSHNILKLWWDRRLRHPTGQLYHQGGDQKQLIDIIFEEDKYGDNWIIMEPRAFNAHPKNYHQGDFIIHYMGHSLQARVWGMKEKNLHMGIYSDRILSKV